MFEVTFNRKIVPNCQSATRWCLDLRSDLWRERIRLGLPDKLEEVTVDDAAKKEQLYQQNQDSLNQLRGIRHPQFRMWTYAECLKRLAECPASDMFFSPATARFNNAPPTLRCVLKLNDARTQEEMDTELFEIEVLNHDGHRKFHVDFMEHVSYDDLDELMARHLEPIALNYNEITNHRKFKNEAQRDITDEWKESMRRKGGAMGAPTIQYCIIKASDPQNHGCKFALLWMDPAKSKTVRTEPIRVTHQGFNLWATEGLTSVDKMLHWWKCSGHKNRQDQRQQMVDRDARHKAKIAKRRDLMQKGYRVETHPEQLEGYDWNEAAQAYTFLNREEPVAGFIQDEDVEMTDHTRTANSTGGQTPVWGSQHTGTGTGSVGTDRTPILPGTGSASDSTPVMDSGTGDGSGTGGTPTLF